MGAYRDRADLHPPRSRAISSPSRRSLTPLQAAHPNDIETYRVASVEPAGDPNTVAVSYVSQQASADTGEFLLTLVREDGHWLVADLEA